jgi:hypothetical protein
MRGDTRFLKKSLTACLSGQSLSVVDADIYSACDGGDEKASYLDTDLAHFSKEGAQHWLQISEGEIKAHCDRHQHESSIEGQAPGEHTVRGHAPTQFSERGEVKPFPGQSMSSGLM